jgi:KaiC/GvpD/RAD55 family RecA-like ATPase
MPHRCAVRAVKKGWYVFPIRKGTKKHALIAWGTQSSNDLDQINAWIKRWPGCNWGINTGMSNLFVIDVDNKKGKNGFESLIDLEIQYGPLPKTYTVKTPNGGLHYYYVGQGKSTNKAELGIGIDSKSSGGMVLCEGSTTEDGEYSKGTASETPLVNQWVLDLTGVKIPKKERDDNPSIELDAGKNVSDAQDYLTYEAEPAVEGLGGDAQTYSVACKVRDFGITKDLAYELLINYYNARCEPPWEFDQLKEKVDNAYNYAENTIGSSTPEADFEVLPTIKKLADIPGFADVIVKGGTFGKIEFPKRTMMLEPWIMNQSMIMIYGEPGVGKSWLALAICLALAKGDNSFCSWAVPNQHNTLFMDAEMVAEDLKERFLTLNMQQPLPNGLHIYSDDHATNQGLPQASLTSENWRDQMKKYLLDNKITFCVFDNLSSLTSEGDENSKEFWSPINNFFLSLKHLGITTLFVHHANKSGDQRGTSAKKDNVDIVVRLEKARDYRLTDGAKFDLIFEKARVKTKYAQQLMGVQLQLTEDLATGCSQWVLNRLKKNLMIDILQGLERGESQKAIEQWSGATRQHIHSVIKKGHISGWLTGAKNNVTKRGKEYILKNLKEEPDDGG